MDGKHLARLALSGLPRPYTEEVVLHVFCEIERTPHLLNMYQELLNDKDRYKDRRALNIDISKRVRDALSSKKVGVVDARACKIVKSNVARLANINSNWHWEN